MKSAAERPYFQGSKAMQSILDPTFTYYALVDADLRRPFRNVRQEMREARDSRADLRQPSAPAPVVHLPTRRRAPIFA
jgi:hypothetical protein